MDHQPERRFFPTEICPVHLETRVGTDYPYIVGYAAVFYDDQNAPQTQFQLGDKMFERIMPGAFHRALQNDDVRALYNHNPDNLLGRMLAGTLALNIDQKGLKYSIKPPETQVGRDVLESIKRGDLTGSSFSFVPRKITWEDIGDIRIRQIRDLQLFDVGPVTYPAYDATTTGLRSLNADAYELEYRSFKSEQKRLSDAKSALARAREIMAEVERRFVHNSKVAAGEPSWGAVDKTKLPRLAFADPGEENKKSTWSYPHHWVQNGSDPNDAGVYTRGTLYLHKGGLNAAWAAAQGAHTGKKASPAVIAHLEAHRRALGLDS